MSVYVYRDGQRLTPWMAYCVERANKAFRAKFGLDLIVSSGIRTHQDQIDIFLDRYRVQWVGNGPYGDVRWWKGKRYVRHSGSGTVAQPGTSNHEIQGDYYAAVDLRDTGKDAGVMTAGTVRANWLRTNAKSFGLEPEGYNFREPWHFRIPNIHRTVPGIIPIPTEEDSMFIAIVRKKDWYLVTGGKACLLGAASGARESGAPILNFVDDWAVAQLKTVVSGIK